MATTITPMIYKAQRTLEVAKAAAPRAVTILGGIHPTFMYAQVLAEAPWIDYIVRGEGEEIVVELLRAIEAGSDRADRATIQGIAYLDEGKLIATPARPVIADLDTLTPDWSLLHWEKYIYVPLNTRVAVPNFARGCPFTCRFCSQWKFWRKYRTRDPRSSSTRSRASCAITRSASSSWPTKSRRSTRRNSSRCARRWSRGRSPCCGASTPA
jgi:anaerobic magnesium-protoporphyrin IX monomethyl ester cyclase